MAFIIGYKMLLRRGRTAQSILAIALLVAILASTSSIVNYLNLQSETLASLISPGGTYLILSRNSTAITDSKLPANLTAQLSNLSFIKQFPQKILTADLITNSTTTIQVRGVEDVDGFLRERGAYINGASAKSWKEADAGEILARKLSIKIGDELCLKVGERQVKVEVVGVFRSRTQCDAELLITMEAAKMLAGDDTISLIELSLKDVSSREMDQINKLGNIRLVQAQQLKEFTQQINMQTLAFLEIWSLAVYAVVTTASYIIATRLVTESSYELSMLRALGAGKSFIFTLILTYTAIIAVLASILGLALGIAGTQTISTVLRWMQPSVEITPFLKPEQALQTALLTLISSTLGCIHPALSANLSEEL
jgi:ABC-type lipoprotein release transport system permease subunit